MKPRFLIKKILIPLDFSKTSLKALDHAVTIAKRSQASITLLHSADAFLVNTEPGYFVPPTFQEDYEKSIQTQSDKHLADIAERVRKKGIMEVNCVTSFGRTTKVILDAARKMKADLVVMGTHGVSGVKEFFMGSNAFRVIREAKCPVLSVQRSSRSTGFRTILMPLRDKPHSREMVDYALDLARLFGSTVHVLAVDTEFTATHRKKVALQAQQIQEIAKHRGIVCKLKTIEHVYMAETILKYAEKIGADLIVTVSSLDKEDITEYFTGPVSQQLVNHSPVPVLSIHPSFKTDTIDLRFY